MPQQSSAHRRVAELPGFAGGSLACNWHGTNVLSAVPTKKFVCLVSITVTSIEYITFPTLNQVYHVH